MPDLLAATFGAHPDDGQDDWPALAAAAAQLQDGQRLVLEAGEYDLDITAPLPSIAVHGKHVIEIAGNGAKLLIRGFDPDAPASQLSGALFSFAGCSDVSVHDLTIDMQRAPFSQGTVIAVAANAFTVQVDDGYAVSGSTKIAAMLSYDPETELPDGAQFDRYAGDSRDPAGYEVAQVGEQRLEIGANVQGLTVGTRLVLRHAVDEYDAIAAFDCEGVTLSHVDVYTIAGMGFHAYGTSDLTVRSFTVRRAPGSNRLLSTTADALHFAWSRGNVVVDQCLLEGMGDNGLNVHSAWLAIGSVDAAEHTVVANLHAPGQYAAFAAGDVLEFADATMQVKGTATVQPGTTVVPGKRSQTLLLDSLPPGLEPGWLVSNVTRIPSSVTVTGTTVRDNRARGFVLQTRDVLVEDCTFQHNTAAAIHVTTDTNYGWEALGARSVIIRGCTITGVNRGALSGAAAIHIFAELPRGEALEPVDAPAGVHQGLKIENNVIEDTPESAIFVGSSRDVTVRGNQLRDISSRPRFSSGRYAVYVKNSELVEIEDTKLSGSFGQGLGQDGSSNIMSRNNDAPL